MTHGDVEDRGALREIAARSITRRDLLKGVGVVGAGLALGPVVSACGGGDGGDTSGGDTGGNGGGDGPKKGGSLKVGTVGGSAKDTTDPQNATTATDTAIQFAMFDTLLGWTPDYELENHLAEEVTPNADATVWTIRLKPDLTWHDGKPVTADDLVFSFQRICDPNAPLPSASSLGGLTPDGVVKKDDRTVELQLPAPNSVLTDGLALRTTMMVPAGFDLNNPIGCGPFKLTDFKPGEQITFAPFDGYWGDGPWVDDLTLIEYADPTARVNAFISGTIDMMTELPRAQKQIVENTDGLSPLEAKTGGWIPFCMRIDQKPFDDVRVRQAFRLMVDRQQMLEQAYAGLGWVANDIYSPYDPGYPKDLPQREQDLEQAKSLLKQAGYSDLSVELVTSDSISSGAVAAALVFAEQAKGAGVNVKVNKVDGGVMYGEDYLKWTFSMDWWLMRNYLVQASAGSTTTAPYNETHWKDEEWQKLVDEAFRTVDVDKRNELVGAAAKIEHERGGYIIWSFNNQLDAYAQKIGGVVPDVSGLPLGGYRYGNYYFM